MSKTATIIAFRDEDLIQFDKDITPVTAEQIEAIPVWLGPRPFLETYPLFRQLIPYVVIKKDNTYLSYRRAKAGNEERLHGNISIGVGGHVDAEDIVLDDEGKVGLIETILDSAHREIEEEIGLCAGLGSLNIVGVIRANDNDVDKHHLAVVILCDITDRDSGELTFENTMDEIEFSTLEDILASPIEKETWTKLTIETLMNR